MDIEKIEQIKISQKVLFKIVDDSTFDMYKNDREGSDVSVVLTIPESPPVQFKINLVDLKAMISEVELFINYGKVNTRRQPL